jgi:hypothetical protein
MDDKTLVDALDSGTFDFRNFRRRPGGFWEYWHTIDGPANNRWVPAPSLRETLASLKAHDEAVAAKRAAAQAARAASIQAAQAANAARKPQAAAASKRGTSTPKPAMPAAGNANLPIGSKPARSA